MKKRKKKRHSQRAPRWTERFRSILREHIEAPLPRMVWVLVLVAAAWRIPFALRAGLWLDEIYVHQQASLAIPDILKTVHFTHYLAIKALLTLWDSETMLRLPSLIFGLLSVPLGFLAARRLFNERVGLWFALFIAVIPYFINYSVDANYYSHMMFWVLWTLYFFGRMFTTRRWWNLLPMIPAALLCFYVHPFSALFFISFGLFLFIHIIATERYFEGIAYYESIWKWRWRRLAGLVGLACAACVLAAAVLELSSVRVSPLRLADRFLRMLEWGKMAENIDLSFDYFLTYFRRIGPAFFRHSYLVTPLLLTFANVATCVLIVLFAWGAALTVRRHATLPLLFLLPFLLTFVLLFNLDPGRHFNIRYISYLVPLYWMAIAVGWVRLEEWIAYKWPTTRVGRFKLAPAVLTAALALVCLPQWLHIALADGRNWDKVAPVLAERIETGAPVVYTNWPEAMMMPYYWRKYDIEEGSLRKLLYEGKRRLFVRNELKWLAYHNPEMWFVSSWQEVDSPKYLEWASDHMELAVYGPSLFLTRDAVWAFYWSMGGRFVWPPRILHYVPGAEQSKPQSTFEETFLFDRTMDYRVRIHLDPNADPAQIRATLDGVDQPMETPDQTAVAEVLFRATIQEGLRQLRLTGSGAAIEVRSIDVIPLYPDGEIPFEGISATSIYPSAWVWMSRL